MQLKRAERKQAKIKLALQGASGSGKTYSALLLANGICKDWTKIAVIDTEHGSSNLYAHLGEYSVVTLENYAPENYIRAIETCETAGVEVIIIDSISHCWDFLIQYHAQLQGNSFTNWAKITPRHVGFIQRMLSSPFHILATMRVKQDYVLNEKDGKVVPQKVGLKSIQRDGVDYEFTIVFDLDLAHNCVASKDRTGLFMNTPEFRITTQTGETILAWCNTGTTLKDIRKLIAKSNTVDELNELYRRYAEFYKELEQDFKARKTAILEKQSLTTKAKQNGTANKSTIK